MMSGDICEGVGSPQLIQGMGLVKEMLTSWRINAKDCLQWRGAMLYALLLLGAVAWYWFSVSRKRNYLPPGPWPRLPLLGHWLQVGDQITVRKMAQLSQGHGDLMLLQMGRRNLVVVSSAELAREVLVTKGIEFASRASNIVFDIFAGAGKDLAFAEYGDHWRRVRRLVSESLFSGKAVERWRSTVWQQEAEAVATTVGNLHSNDADTTPVALRDSLQWMVHNAMYRMTFGVRFESQSDPLYQKLKFLNDERGRLAQTLCYNFADFHTFMRPLLWGYLRTCHEVKVARENVFKHFLSERWKKLKSPAQRKTTPFGIDPMIAAVESGELQEQHVLYIMDNLNAAGIVTLSASLEWAVAELVNNPHIQDKLHKEIVEVVGSKGEITLAECNKLRYLQAIIKETMRLHASVPLIVPHLNLKPEKLGGYDIPARSKIIVNSWWIANNPKYWKDPEIFNPDRFLNEEQLLEFTGNDFRFLPFGYGRRQCPGISMASALMQLTLAQLVQKYEMLPPCGEGKDMKLNLSEFHGQMLNMMAVAPKVILKHRHA